MVPRSLKILILSKYVAISYLLLLFIFFVKLHVFLSGFLKLHKIVEEELHLAATKMTAQVLKEPLQRAALDISLDTWHAKRYQEFNLKPLKHKM